MLTEIVKINPGQLASLKQEQSGSTLSIIKKAAEIIRNGGLVVLPTDTVYGLACDATNPKAVAKVFLVKKRPLTQPLSIAISRFQDIKKYALEIPAFAKTLAKKFLPGPLTLVLKKSHLIPDIVTTNKDNIGIRIPDSKIVLMLIKTVRRPIVIPSANIHNKPSSVTAQQVLKDLDGKVDLIIDGGKTKYSVESTIVSCINNKIKILREGAIASKKILSLASNEVVVICHRKSCQRRDD